MRGVSRADRGLAGPVGPFLFLLMIGQPGMIASAASVGASPVLWAPMCLVASFLYVSVCGERWHTDVDLGPNSNFARPALPHAAQAPHGAGACTARGATNGWIFLANCCGLSSSRHSKTHCVTEVRAHLHNALLHGQTKQFKPPQQRGGSPTTCELAC